MLVDGIPTPLKNMSSSVGIIIPNIWKTNSNVPNHQSVYPLEMTNIASNNGPVEILDLSIKHGGSFHSFLYVTIPLVAVPLVAVPLVIIPMVIIPMEHPIIQWKNYGYDRPVYQNMAMFTKKLWKITMFNGYITIFNGTSQFLKLPIGSMYGIYANIGGIVMVNVTIYGIHGSYGLWCFFQWNFCKSFPQRHFRSAARLRRVHDLGLTNRLVVVARSGKTTDAVVAQNKTI